MRSKSSVYNLMAATVLQFVTLIIGIILPKLMIEIYGSEINGLVSSIKQFISYITLVEAGLAGACIYSLYKPLANNQYSEINSILSSAKKFYNKSGIIFSILVLVLVLIFPYIIDSENINNITIMGLVLVLGINGSMEFFSMGKYRVLLTADQKSYIISLIQTIGQIVNFSIIILLSIKGVNIVIVQLFASLSYILRSLLFGFYVNKKYKYIDLNAQPNDSALAQRWDVLFHQVASMVVFNSPIILITIFCNLKDVSIYTVYNMIFVGINGIIGIFANGLVAGIGDILSRKDINLLQRVYKEYECIYYMLITWVYSCSYILIIPFVIIYTSDIHDANYIRHDLAICFVLIGILNTLRSPQATLVSAAGHFKRTRNKTLIEVIINLTASIFFVIKFGVIGVLLGSICSYLYRTVDLILYVPKHITMLPIRQTFFRIIRLIIAFFIIIYPFITNIIIQTNTMFDWIKYAILVSIWSGIVVFVVNFIFEKSTLVFFFKRLSQVFSRNN